MLVWFTVVKFNKFIKNRKNLKKLIKGFGILKSDKFKHQNKAHSNFNKENF